MTYDRSRKMYDEPHSPQHIDSILKNKTINKGKFLNSAHCQSYLLQMRTIHGLKRVRSVLEIGPGENFAARNLRSIGYKYDTVDQDTTHNPTIISSLQDLNPESLKNQYDLLCAFQILEHMPYDQSIVSLKKMMTISKKYVLISLPYSCNGYNKTHTEWVGRSISRSKRDSKFLPSNLPNRKYRKEFVEEFPWAVHYWEIGRKGFPLSRLEKDIRSMGLNIIKQFHSPNPYHYFILMAKP